MDAAAVAPDNRVARVEFNGLIKIGDSACKIAMIASRLAAVIPGRDVPRVELTHDSEVADRRIDSPQLVANESANEVGVGLMWVQLDGPVKIAERPRQIAFTPPRQTAVVVSGRRPRIKRNREVVIGDGAIPFPFRHPLGAAFKI